MERRSLQACVWRNAIGVPRCTPKSQSCLIECILKDVLQQMQLSLSVVVAFCVVYLWDADGRWGPLLRGRNRTESQLPSQGKHLLMSVEGICEWDEWRQKLEQLTRQKWEGCSLLLTLRLRHIHDSKAKNTFYWKTTLLITRQFHRHYVELGGSSRKKIKKKCIQYNLNKVMCKRLIPIAPSGYLGKEEITFLWYMLRSEWRKIKFHGTVH